jgi:hypothetical protein
MGAGQDCITGDHMNNQQKNINVGELIADIDGKIPENLKPIYQKAVLSGMRIMFDKQSHKMLLDQIDKPGPMPQKMADGVIGLIYLLWTQSNKTLPPQIIVPLTVVLTLRGFQFLQESKDPEATNDVLGEAMALATTGIMAKFGVNEDQLPGLVKGNQRTPKQGLINAQMRGMQNG